MVVGFRHKGLEEIYLTGKTRRKFRVNMQRVRAVIDGKVTRINVSAKAIRMGKIV